MVPFDDKSPFVTSGIRIGTPAMTTRGLGASEFEHVVDLIDRVLSDPTNESEIEKVKARGTRALQTIPALRFCHSLIKCAPFL